jgi:hypothetical protein
LQDLYKKYDHGDIFNNKINLKKIFENLEKSFNAINKDYPTEFEIIKERHINRYQTECYKNIRNIIYKNIYIL